MEDRKSTARLSEEARTLRDFVRRQPYHAELRYTRVQRETRIDMSPESGNRDKLREAIIAVGRRYEIVPNISYILDSAENAIRIGGHAQRKLVNAAIRSEETATMLIRNNGDQMPADDLKALERIRAGAGQSLAVAEASMIAKEEEARSARKPRIKRPPTTIPYTPLEA